MIRLKKGPAPKHLADNAAEWTRVVLSKIEAGEEPSAAEKGRYNHPDIKRALLSETNNKCAYCESKVRHVAYGDIEHVAPKSDEPGRMFDWHNLTIACDVCNTNKHNAPVAGDNFIDPYNSEPEQAFWLVGPLVFPQPGHEAAIRTERLIKLNRAELVERRTERLTALLSMLNNIELSASPDIKDILWKDFCSEAGADKEFAALARRFRAEASARLGREAQ